MIRILCLPLFFSIALAAPRVQTATITIIQNNKHVQIEVQTDNPAWDEMSFYIYQPGNARQFDRRIVPPSQPGVYQLEYTFPDYGQWRINLRKGIGLDRYYGDVGITVDGSSQVLTRRSVFQGDLDINAPRYIQSIGFGIFGFLLLITLILIGALLRWIKRRAVIRAHSSPLPDTFG